MDVRFGSNGHEWQAVARPMDMTERVDPFHRRSRTGRRRFTTARDDRFIVSTTLRNRHLNAVQVPRQQE